MRAELKALDAADTLDGSHWSFRPEDSERFVLWVTASVGLAGEAGARWNPALAERAIGDLCRNTEGESWTEIAQKLSGFLGQWEFEDYRG